MEGWKMVSIPNKINDVDVEFASTVVNSVEQTMLDGVISCIKSDIASGFTLSKVYISSVKDGSHASNSRHFQGSGKAVDVSRINGKKMSVDYPSDAEVKAIVEAIQTAFESYSQRRENFGPFFKKKLGVAHVVGGHKDHIHLSVN
jgi:hypothetical protein